MLKIKHIFPALVLLALSSCMNDMALEPNLDAYPPIIEGKVMYVPDNSIISLPIEHIKVTFDWGGSVPADIKYTSGEGIFFVEIPEAVLAEEIPVSITLEDVDGEENGGLFESFTDNIIYSLDYYSPTETLSYRLTHATASESSRRF